MRTKIFGFIILPIIFLASSFMTFTQEQANEDVIRVDTTLISIPVIVSDRQGRYIADLEAKDFTLYKDGTKQNIDLFAKTEEPLNIALLIDTSRSTNEVLGDIKKAAIDFVRQLKPQDKAMIVSFDYAPHVLSPLTSDQKELKRAIKNAEIGEYVGTTLRQALEETINNSLAKVKGRKAIILLTDGKDHGSEISTAELIRSVEESDTMIYSIFYETGFGFNQPNQRNQPFPRRNGRIFDRRLPDDNRQQRQRQRREINNKSATDFLQNLADATAGRFYESEVTNLGKTFGLIIDELRFQYRLGFYPNEEKEVGTLHQLKVQVARENVSVRARRSYRLEK